MEVPIFLKLRMLWNGPLRNLATQPVSWPVKIETALPESVKGVRYEPGAAVMNDQITVAT
jgi:hypothetical protein